MNRQLSIGKRIPNTGAMDFSFLCDAPAGKHGFLSVKDGHFYFEDGTRGKFIGFNLPVRACMPDHETAEVLSRRFASMGINCIRMTGMDAVSEKEGWSCAPGYSLIDYESGTSGIFLEAGRERFDYFCSCLKKRGIYLHIDLLVARKFLKGDGTDNGKDLRQIKACSHINQRLIDLQKEYASGFLGHVNPYTGKSLLEEPAVMCFQICNEDSIFFAVSEEADREGIAFYREEIRKKFNKFLLEKYKTRESLAKAWTFEGKCALKEEEDPSKGTVKPIHMGSYTQPMMDPLTDWTAEENPSRYADYTEFGRKVNHEYYREMLSHLRKIGAKVPLVTSCLLEGAADAESHTDGDFMENNAYFNHPDGGDGRGMYVPNLREYLAADPRTESFAEVEPRSNLVTQAAFAKVKGKPFVLSEWNEYGEYPFHAAAFLQTAAYACLQDWDGLIIYCYHDDDNLDRQPSDRIDFIMNAYNDPSLILQFGTMAAVFLKGLVRKADHLAELIYTEEDLAAEPLQHRMPFSVLPFVTRVESIFLKQGEKYAGTADVSINSGFVSSGDLTEARHGILYAHSPYKDAFRTKYVGEEYFVKHADPSEEEPFELAGTFTADSSAAAEMSEIEDSTADSSAAAETSKVEVFTADSSAAAETSKVGVFTAENSEAIEISKSAVYETEASETAEASEAKSLCRMKEVLLGDRYLKFLHINEATSGYNFRPFAQGVDFALRKWGILPEGTGISGKEGHGAMVSETGEICFDPENAAFSFEGEECAFFAGKPAKILRAGEGKYQLELKNDRMAVSILSLDKKSLKDSRHCLISAVGRSGMDETEYVKVSEYRTCFLPKGKLFMDTAEGIFSVRKDDHAEDHLWALDVYGNRMEEIAGIAGEDGMKYVLTGFSYGNFEWIRRIL